MNHHDRRALQTLSLTPMCMSALALECGWKLLTTFLEVQRLRNKGLVREENGLYHVTYEGNIALKMEVGRGSV